MSLRGIKNFETVRLQNFGWAVDYTGWHKKNGNVWKPQQKLKKSKEKKII